MNKPELCDFGLTEHKYELIKKNKEIVFNNSIRAFILLAYIIPFIIGVVGINFQYNIYNQLIGIAFASLLFAIPIFGFLFILFVFIEDRIPSFKKIKSYELALANYNNWWRRTKEIFWKSLDGISFEHELGALFKKNGYNVKVTTASNDKGIDIIIFKQKSFLTIVQCKAQKKPVGPSVARELYGTLKSCGANEGIIASVSGFTKGVSDFVNDKPIKLLSLHNIIDMQKRLEY